jgi:hypothetical protein
LQQAIAFSTAALVGFLVGGIGGLICFGIGWMRSRFSGRAPETDESRQMNLSSNKGQNTNCLLRLMDYVADQIDIGYGWIGDLISALIFTVMAIYSTPLIIDAAVFVYDKRDTLSRQELITVCLLGPILPLVAIGLPLVLFRLAVRKVEESLSRDHDRVCEADAREQGARMARDAPKTRGSRRRIACLGSDR